MIEASPVLPSDDRLTPFQRPMLAVRLGALVASVVLASPAISDGEGATSLAALALVAYSSFRLARPLRFSGDVASVLRLAVDVVVPVLAINATGHWSSPFVLMLVTPICLAGFASGVPLAASVGFVATLAVGVPDLATTDESTSDSLRAGGQWAAELLLVTLVAGYARRISGEAARQQSLVLDRMERLTQANALLFSLHRVAQTLPASLDLDEVLESTTSRLRELFDCDSTAVLLPDETDSSWHVARRFGARLPTPLTAEALPEPLRRAMRQPGPVREDDLFEQRGPGLNPRAASGLYAALRARGALVGLLAIEHEGAVHFGPRDVELLEGFVEPAALAIDNARWFGRLRTVGADEERMRIARDLHDRIGQSLAYLAFELDRLVKTARETPMEAQLDQLRQDVRGVIREVRDTLYDLRTDVSETRPLASILDAFLQRIRDRSPVTTELDWEEHARLPLPQEREMWRIAQEAITNAERHANARNVHVRWRSDGRRALLVVEDDGNGFAPDRDPRMDSYGMLGMRERAASIGARLEVDSEAGGGTTVRCELRPG